MKTPIIAVSLFALGLSMAYGADKDEKPDWLKPKTKDEEPYKRPTPIIDKVKNSKCRPMSRPSDPHDPGKDRYGVECGGSL